MKRFYIAHIAGASIYVASGFNVSSLEVQTNFGSGELYMSNIVADEVTVDHSG